MIFTGREDGIALVVAIVEPPIINKNTPVI
jgi:hypothetical protein